MQKADYFYASNIVGFEFPFFFPVGLSYTTFVI